MASNLTSVYIPYYKRIRAVVGLPDGGLSNPPPLLFDPTLGHKPMDPAPRKFLYPQLTNVTRPTSDVDVAYMTVTFHL